MAVEREATVVWEGDLKGNGELSVPTGAIQDTGMTFARRAGEPEGHTSPEELIAAAHAGCFAMSFSNVLARAGNAPDRLEVTANCIVDIGEKGLAITKVELTAKGRVPGIDAAGFEEAAKKAESTCPVSNALRNNVEINLSTELEG